MNSEETKNQTPENPPISTPGTPPPGVVVSGEFTSPTTPQPATPSGLPPAQAPAPQAQVPAPGQISNQAPPQPAKGALLLSIIGFLLPVVGSPLLAFGAARGYKAWRNKAPLGLPAFIIGVIGLIGYVIVILWLAVALATSIIKGADQAPSNPGTKTQKLSNAAAMLPYNTNVKFPLQLDMPEKWTILDEEPGKVVVFADGPKAADKPFTPRISVTGEEESNVGSNGQAWFNQYLSGSLPAYQGFKLLDKSKVTLKDNREGYLVSYEYEVDGQAIQAQEVVTFTKNAAFTVQGAAPKDQWSKYKDTFKSSLLSFQPFEDN